MTSTEAHPYIHEVAPSPKPTGLSYGLLWWSIANHLLAIVTLFLGPLTFVPLIVIGHKHLGTIKRENLGGRELTITALVINYMFAAAWITVAAFFAVTAGAFALFG